jgi:hypothetical protein
MKKFSTIGLVAVALLLGTYMFVVKAGEDRGRQLIDAYLDPANHSRDKVKLHLALKLATGQWNDRQRELIVQGMNYPMDVREDAIGANFSRDDVGAVFYKIGSVDIEDLRQVYELPIGKSELVHSWAKDRQDRVWQMNAALALVRYDLSPLQQQFVVDFAAAIPAITRANAELWDQRAVDVGLPRNVGRGLLTTIGDDRCPGQFAAVGRLRMLPQCVCTTKAGNWSCNDSCHGEGTCNIVLGDCGILWLYDCNGMCDNQEA